MAYKFIEVPERASSCADIVLADTQNPNALAFNHLAYVMETTSNKDNILDNRGISFRDLRNWQALKNNYPQIQEIITGEDYYYPGASVLEAQAINPQHRVKTVLKLGALELLANIYSGRITVSDKDPFPHQLALQQYVKANESRIQRMLIADEVGLGKTIEVGLILRDKLITQKDEFRCLYLTSAGLKEDVRDKLKSVIKDSGDRSLITVVDSFKNYGDTISTNGIRIASLQAARLYLTGKRRLPDGVRPNIIIIDECHHCSSRDGLEGESVDSSESTTQAYKAAHQLITGKFWHNSTAPDLVILMSATPFRSAPQFTNLLRLLAHKTVMENAYANNIGQRQLLEAIENSDGRVTLVWRQQDEVRNWSDRRLFPNLTIVRPHREGQPTLEATDDRYLQTLERIKRTVQQIYHERGRSFGGFATAHLETRLTSSSLAGACWLFRWCVRHHPRWQSEKFYKDDKGDDTRQLRALIREISRRLAQYDEKRNVEYAEEVNFPSDGNFKFTSRNLGEGMIPAIYEFQKQLLDTARRENNHDPEDPDIEATVEEIVELTQLAFSLLSSGSTVENAKLNWLKAMLQAHPDSRFLVFTEVLQTTSIITATFPRQSLALTGGLNSDERKEVIRKFYDRTRNYRILVATSAADEGLDFQVANKVVHWDISSDPAVLMQRNGRVARLGQVSDVTAYYLILEGTLAEKRDSALVDRMATAGITDDRMQLKILGQLDDRQRERLMESITPDGIDEGTVDDVLKAARQNSNLMERELTRLNEQLTPQWVIDRTELLNRLKAWEELQYIQHDYYRYKLSFENQTWSRPIFSEQGTVMEFAKSEIVAIQHFQQRKSRFNFDPEYGLFSQDRTTHKLAGLLPWFKAECEEQGRTFRKHDPLLHNDPIGCLCGSLARQTGADFLTVPAQKIRVDFPELQNIDYLLFATHPLRELESDCDVRAAKYLTYYAFTKDSEGPLDLRGVCARKVHQMITFLEKQALEEQLMPDDEIVDAAKNAGRIIYQWITNSLAMGSDSLFDEESNYFLPVPVALIAIV
ncbi:MAG: RNA polymerase-associated protein RapA [Chroococcopsis gigantea SAG 12.99]|jgi:superfamily II DNA or RNA helicase|nr:DEAD/DEAH box helicase [Chlorogloea purpurea SAG 13.99]MDV3001484.1 RNA polymerase-associated protein RapA [Chroococcopsis gigantea SAG 12.99]